jgi:hypothetical protein
VINQVSPSFGFLFAALKLGSQAKRLASKFQLVMVPLFFLTNKDYNNGDSK